ISVFVTTSPRSAYPTPASVAASFLSSDGFPLLSPGTTSVHSPSLPGSLVPGQNVLGLVLYSGQRMVLGPATTPQTAPVRAASARARYNLKMFVVPESSWRTTRMILFLHSASPGLVATSSPSDHSLASPPMIRETSLPVKFSAVGALPLHVPAPR